MPSRLCPLAPAPVLADAVAGSGWEPREAPGGWRGLGATTVYFDHPVHAQALHTLNIDFGDPSGDPSGRIALELTASSARELVAAIERALSGVPPELLV